ncbi:MAG TPA: NAD(P)H-binding protein [Chitinophagaceae bacterium]|jgi:putative NADH-flavin reductase
MQTKLKIAVIGGTGKSGKYLVQQLLSQGFHLKMLVRNPAKFSITSPFIEIIPGDVREYKTVRRLIEGCQAVISTLGQSKGETPIFSTATRNVIRAMKEYQIQRYILITGLNVDTPFDKKGDKTAFGTEWMKTHYPDTTTDKQTEWSVLSKTDIDWTLVRLPLIELTNETRKVEVSLEDCPGDKIAAIDLAKFLIGQLSDNRFIKKSPFIANV